MEGFFKEDEVTTIVKEEVKTEIAEFQFFG